MKYSLALEEIGYQTMNRDAGKLEVSEVSERHSEKPTCWMISTVGCTENCKTIDI